VTAGHTPTPVPEVTAIRIGAVAARFSRDLDFDLRRVATLIEHARRSRISLLVLPDAALGGYLGDLRQPDRSLTALDRTGTR
jgi:hypothetical protein